MIQMIGVFFAGLLVGGAVGFFTAALLVASGRAEEMAKEQRRDLLALQAVESENPSLRDRLADEHQRYETLRVAYHDLKREAAAYARLAGTGHPTDRDCAIVAYIDAGHSYREAAQAFGLSKSRVGVIVKEHRECEEKTNKNGE